MKEIARRLVGNVWQTGVVDEDTGGGSQSLQVIGPFPITKDTPELVNPSGNGALVGPELPAGSVVFAVWIGTTTPWAAETSIDELDINLNTISTGLVSLVNGVDGVLNEPAITLTTSVGGNIIGQLPAYLRSVPGQIAIAIYTTGAMTAGEGDVYALAYIPA